MLENKVDPNMGGWNPLHYAAFENRDRIAAMLLQGQAQHFQVRLASAVHIQRVDAQRIGTAMRMGQLPHGIEMRHLHRGQHQVGDAGRYGALHHGGAIGFELRCIQVAVRIDPHGAMMAQLCTVAPAAAAAT
jgi:hypothetical protein